MSEYCDAVWPLGTFDVVCELPEGHSGRHHADEFDETVSASIDWSER